ncbi:chaperonin 1, chloroplastic-like protein [Cinnamomum micranthum f. kanehirae]|uniref:Chaperonin 1, chloroplastic-like protein n=1 Tax=Cinnamomum micranthum f. kanehirae TaxID=337451 RepID=A0A443P9A3_9MAGN|nr:chaperonin 1, chloroplastic-like protein [Cinnamomum micranthum f. kanehirae]
MASNFIFTAVSNPCFLSASTSSPPFQGLPKHALRINAVAQKWEPSKVVPQADNVLIRLEELPKKSTGGVLLPAIAVNFDRCLMGEVLSVGAEVGGVKAGTKVDLGKDARYCFCRASDLMARDSAFKFKKEYNTISNNNCIHCLQLQEEEEEEEEEEKAT